jgi:hypothetical protein
VTAPMKGFSLAPLKSPVWGRASWQLPVAIPRLKVPEEDGYRLGKACLKHASLLRRKSGTPRTQQCGITQEALEEAA